MSKGTGAGCSPGPTRSLVLALLLLAMLLCIVVVNLIVALPPGSWYAPRMPPRVYNAVPLALVLADMERQGVIPAGTKWNDMALKNRPVSERFFFLPRDLDALERIAVGACVVIEFPQAYHGEIMGPVRVMAADGREAGIEPYRYQPPGP